MAKEYFAPDEYRMVNVEGIPLNPNLFSPDHIRGLKDLQLHKDDVLVTGYMKSGNIWTMTTVSAIMASANLDEFEKEGPQVARVPMEVTEWKNIEKSLKRPSVFYTHMRPRLLPKSNKIINITRNPKDIAVSFYHFAKLMKSTASEFGADWSTYISNFYIKEDLVFGKWFDYMEEWLPLRGDPNILYINYEDFVENPEKMIETIADFLSKPLSLDQIQRIANLVSFDSMRNNAKLDHHIPGLFDQPEGRFLRKGKVGDWRNYFNEEENKAFDDLYKPFAEKHGLNIRFELE